MSSTTDANHSSDDLLSSLDAAFKKVEDLEMRVNEVLGKQQDTQKALQTMKAEILTSNKPVDGSEEEETPEIKFREDHHYTEELKKLMEDMQNTQKTWMENVKIMAKAGKEFRGAEVFKDIHKHLSERLEYLEAARVLLEGPLVEEPPPPPPPPSPPPPPEEPPEKEKKKHKKDKKKKK